MPGIVKVGFSLKDPELRAAELYHTGSPHKYFVDYEVLVNNPHDVEQSTHKRLRSHREGKEWFRCSAEEAIAAIKTVVDGQEQLENYKRADRKQAEAIVLNQEAEKRFRITAEENRRKQEVEIKRRRQEIYARYDPVLKSALPASDTVASSFVLFLPVFFVVWFIGEFITQMQGGFFWAAFVLSAVLTPVLIWYYREAAKRTPKYQAILAKQDLELSSIKRKILAENGSGLD